MSERDETFTRLVNGVSVRIDERAVSAIWSLIEAGQERQRVESLSRSTRRERQAVLVAEAEAVSGMVDQIAALIAEHSHVSSRRRTVWRETFNTIEALQQARERVDDALGRLQAQRDALDHETPEDGA